jgi:phytanoyl-CoA hydroxylase
MDGITSVAGTLLTHPEIAQYRRAGFVVVRGLLGPANVGACLRALSDLAYGRILPRHTRLVFEPGYDHAAGTPAERELKIREFRDFVADAPTLLAAAMSARLHAILDQLLGQGRVLFQEVALVRPPQASMNKPWHQDAVYYPISDPGLIVSVWVALDPALASTGCLEVAPNSHLGGRVPHRHDSAINSSCIVPERAPAVGLPLEMQPGDAVIFHALLHHFAAPNHSPSRRRALQFHYHQTGAMWNSPEEHRSLFSDVTGRYDGPAPVPHPTSYHPGALGLPPDEFVLADTSA